MSITMKKALAIVLALTMLISCMVVFASCDKPDDKKDASYTYNTYLSVFPDVWNNHTYQTATDSEIIGYTENGFFTFDYNEAKDGYKVVPDMATKEPEDVTADYVGQYGIAEGDASRAWKITIRDNIKWEDGTLITANDFVESLKLLLNPVADNYRADSVYSGDLELVGAKDYFYQGESGWFTAANVLDTYSEDLDDKLVFTIGPAMEDYDAISYLRNWLETSCGAPADYPLDKTVAFLQANWLGKEAAFTYEAVAAMEGKTFAEIKADPTMKAAWDALIGWWQTEPNEELHFFIYDYTYPEQSWDTVGVKALSDTELVIFLQRPLKGFYLLYNLTGNLNLVNVKLYNECMSISADGIYNNTYGTSAETYMSYGPYKLTEFQDDKSIVLEKNDQWYGYSDPANDGLYQTTKVAYKFINEPETAMLSFLKGELDAKGLDANQIGDYSKSEHVYYTDGASTFFIALNPDMEALTEMQTAAGDNINKTILTIKEFRMALSFALDRAAFNLACDPTGSVGLAVYNNLIISDPENGTAYRTTDEAKQVLAEFWGVSDDIGEGKMYANIDDAIASITGYNLEEAKNLFNAAYDKAIADGLMDADDKVEIKIGTPNATSVFYTNGYEFLVNCYTEAVKGTKLEGKLQFTIDNTLGNAFSDALKANQVDMLFGVGWTGSALDPYGLMEAYTGPDYQYDPAWDTSKEQLVITLKDGVAYTASVLDWTYAIMGEEIEIVPTTEGAKGITFSCGSTKEDPAERLHILAAIEGAVLATYDLIPINNESSAALKGMKINYYTEEYIYGVGRGGIKYMTYNYTDEEWTEFVASQNGQLNYK